MNIYTVGAATQGLANYLHGLSPIFPRSVWLLDTTCATTAASSLKSWLIFFSANGMRCISSTASALLRAEFRHPRTRMPERREHHRQP